MIYLTKTLAISADEYCYAVGRPRERIRENKKTIELIKPTYHATIDQALQAAVNRAMRELVANEEITTLQQVIERQRELQENFRKMIEPVRLNS